MKDREIICKYYSCAGGPCSKRGINVFFKNECQTCRKYDPLPGGKPFRTDTRAARKERAEKRDLRY